MESKRGNQGYGKAYFIKEKVTKYEELWWKEWEAMMIGDDKDDRKFAMAEFNKLQQKMMPTDLTSMGKPFVIQIAKEAIERHDDTTSSAEEDNKGQAQV
jgi:hypothetical protein